MKEKEKDRECRVRLSRRSPNKKWSSIVRKDISRSSFIIRDTRYASSSLDKLRREDRTFVGHCPAFTYSYRPKDILNKTCDFTFKVY